MGLVHNLSLFGIFFRNYRKNNVFEKQMLGLLRPLPWGLAWEPLRERPKDMTQTGTAALRVSGRVLSARSLTLPARGTVFVAGLEEGDIFRVL